jgi:hypothetical protein
MKALSDLFNLPNPFHPKLARSDRLPLLAAEAHAWLGGERLESAPPPQCSAACVLAVSERSAVGRYEVATGALVDGQTATSHLWQLLVTPFDSFRLLATSRI